MLLENIDTSENVIERTCYICGVDLMKEYKKDTSQQNDFEESMQKFPTMIRYDGQTKELCALCYKNHLSSIEVYQKNHPE